MSSEKINDLDNNTAKLALALQIEKLKLDMVSEYYDCGVWEYDIHEKSLIQSKKLK